VISLIALIGFAGVGIVQLKYPDASLTPIGLAKHKRFWLSFIVASFTAAIVSYLFTG